MVLLRDVVMAKEGLGGFVVDKRIVDSRAYEILSGYSLEKINSIMNDLIKYKRSLEGNANPKLIAQVLPSSFC